MGNFIESFAKIKIKSELTVINGGRNEGYNLVVNKTL